MKHHIYIILFLFVSIGCYAQTESSTAVFLQSAPSPKGNYLFLYEAEQLASTNSPAKTTAYFIVERTVYSSLKLDEEIKIEKTETIKPVSTVAELQRYFSKSRIEELQQLFKVTTPEAVAEFFATHPEPADYPFVYTAVETKQALAHVYLDENVKDNELYYYRVTRVAKDGSKQDWGFAIVQSKSGNYTLPYYKPQLSSVETADSIVRITWKMPVPDNLFNQIPVPKSTAVDDTINVYRRILLSPLSIRAAVYLQKNGRFNEEEKLLPVVNESNDTVTFSFYKKCNPEEAVTAYLLTEDEVYNKGISSDTAYAFAVEQKSVPLIYGIRVKDILNGVRISWDALPAKPYIAGVEIGRYNSNNEYDSVTILNPADTFYIDYKVAVGQTYRYKVNVLFLPQLPIAQLNPAEGVGTFTIFNRPLPPANLTVEDQKGIPVLKWETTADPSYYGSFVYRGTSPSNLEVVAGPITTNQFTDTSKNITGRSEYYYAVLNQNLREDTSVYSNIVRIVPSKKIITTTPSAIDFYYANGVLRVSWNDVRSMDNAIESFVVQRKTGNQSTYRFLTSSAIANNFIEDKDIQKGIVYDYRVAAISYRGDTSEYSNAYRYSLPDEAGATVGIFYLRNTSEGIVVSWPEVLYENRKAYTIYRRQAAEKNFIKLATVNSNTFSYTDRTVREEKVYVYAITVTQTNGKEGARGISKSLRRQLK
jgi:hypothetical protein